MCCSISFPFQLLREVPTKLLQIEAAVERPKSVRIDAQDIKGKKFSINLKEWQARIFQHEYDHLEGTLYFDRMTPEVLDTIRPELERFEKLYEERTSLPSDHQTMYKLHNLCRFNKSQSTDQDKTPKNATAIYRLLLISSGEGRPKTGYVQHTCAKYAREYGLGVLTKNPVAVPKLQHAETSIPKRKIKRRGTGTGRSLPSQSSKVQKGINS